MKELIRVKTITEAHQMLGLEKPKHPLVSVAKLPEQLFSSSLIKFKYTSDLYTINLKAGMYGTCNYGRNTYDHQEGTLVFIAPNQTISYEPNEDKPNFEESWALMFHPDLIRKSELGKKIEEYSFFNYDANEALHISDDEKKSLNEIKDKITKEYSQNIDQHSQELIVSNIKLLLDYSKRYFDRQFYTRTNFNSDIVSRFERLLKDYYKTDKPTEIGLPTVAYLGKQLAMSPYYLSDLLKKETGRNTIEHIHFFIIEQAKTSLLNSELNISEIAYNLGFEYPQHFTKLFKNKTGLNPSEYRNGN